MKNPILLLALSIGLVPSVSVSSGAATLFNNAALADELISNAGNWNNGLPTGQQGT